MEYSQVIETFLAMLTAVCHFKHLSHRVWDYFETRLAFTMALSVCHSLSLVSELAPLLK
jgi:hypothetical protein